jgi:hypothetical protein
LSDAGRTELGFHAGVTAGFVERHAMNAPSPLEPAQLIAEARRETGLHEFDDPSIEEPLARLTQALRTEARLNAAGVGFWHWRIRNTLIARLRANDWFQRHPEIDAEQLPPPVVILGLARTGTTLLHRLLAADSRFYSAAWWECRFPVPAADDVGGEQRKAAAQAEVAAILEAQPELAAIHPWDALGADEDIMLIDQTLLSTTAESLACIPSYRAWIHEQDLRPAYRYLLRLMRFLQWQKKQRGEPAASRWVLKTPMHLGYVDVIAELMPDAMFVQTHRDPITTIPSFSSLVHGLWAGGSDSADAYEASHQWCATFEEHLNRCLEVRRTLPAQRFIDVDFRDTVSRPMAVVERIYRRIGLPMTDEARSRIEEYMRTHPREGRPKHEYTLEQFGFTRAELERRFAAYREKHILPFTQAPASGAR